MLEAALPYVSWQAGEEVQASPEMKGMSSGFGSAPSEQGGGGRDEESGVKEVQVVVGAEAGRTCAAGWCNVVVGHRANVWLASDGCATAVGAGASAGAGAASFGCRASARGSSALALGRDAIAAGDGAFSVAGRVTGGFLDPAPGPVATYGVSVDADVLRLRGAALAMCDAGAPADAPVSGARWLMALEPDGGGLVLRCARPGGACVRFTDEFLPGLLNFTGQHRCAVEGEVRGDDASGCVVVATGRYLDLSGAPGLAGGADEAVPVVTLARTPHDPRVFGVISDWEAAGPVREWALGGVRFAVPRAPSGRRRAVINSAGEGWIRVCDEGGGSIRNGDLLTSSSVPGLAMRQRDDAVRACTVAKATCDCDFDQPLLPATGRGRRTGI
ncbi:hypothetical protein V8C86DRAFT_3170080 [Haematococcus lacustris]